MSNLKPDEIKDIIVAVIEKVSENTFASYGSIENMTDEKIKRLARAHALYLDTLYQLLSEGVDKHEP